MRFSDSLRLMLMAAIGGAVLLGCQPTQPDVIETPGKTTVVHERTKVVPTGPPIVVNQTPPGSASRTDSSTTTTTNNPPDMPNSQTTTTTSKTSTNGG